jgi:hypothetical protein
MERRKFTREFDTGDGYDTVRRRRSSRPQRPLCRRRRNIPQPRRRHSSATLCMTIAGLRTCERPTAWLGM